MSVWLIGAGIMSQDYAKVLTGQDRDYLVIGRGEAKAKEFTEKTGKEVIPGGLEAFLSGKPEAAEAAIVSVGVEALTGTTLQLLDYGVKRILIEKPGGRNGEEIDQIRELAESKGAQVLLAYNRRFFASTRKALEIISEDGGVTSFHFEFTEWSHVIQNLQKGEGVMETWFLANSTHVADLAFYLGGFPTEIHSFVKGGLDWHPAASIFAGAGLSEKGAIFNYQANWEAPGRWAVEVLTKKHRLYFKPMEMLQIQKIGSVALAPVEIEDQIDKDYKPGLYLQTQAFLQGEDQGFCTIQEQVDHYPIYAKIAGY